MRIEIWHHVVPGAVMLWGLFYSWDAALASLPADALVMGWGINKAIRPRAIQLHLHSRGMFA